METKNYINEVWKPIRGYVGYYEVSNFGRVRSLDRWITYEDGRKQHYESVLLILKKKKSGYLYVCLSRNGEHKWFRVHRLVAEAFIPNPNNLPEVNHKDEDKTNNIWTNLEWVSRKTNINWGTGIERSTDTRREAVFQFDLNNNFIRKGISVSELCRELGYSQGNVSACCRFERRIAHNSKWSYIHESTIQLDDAPCEFDASYCIIPT